MRATKAADGEYLSIEFTILNGEYAERKLWTNLNLRNPNTTAVRHAEGELSAVCRAVGVMEPKDSIELHNLPLVITVKCRKREDTGETVNEIKGYAKKSGIGNGSQAETKDKAPWARGDARA